MSLGIARSLRLIGMMGRELPPAGPANPSQDSGLRIFRSGQHYHRSDNGGQGGQQWDRAAQAAKVTAQAGAGAVATAHGVLSITRIGVDTDAALAMVRRNGPAQWPGAMARTRRSLRRPAPAQSFP
jgi:hypothetical protein